MKRIINTAIVYFIFAMAAAYFIGNLQNGTDIQSRLH